MADAPITKREVTDATKQALICAIGIASVLKFLDTAITLIAKAG